MTDQAQQPAEPVIPDLDREEVRKRSQGTDLLGWEDFGDFTFALRQFQFRPGTKKNPHYYATFKILTSTCATREVGTETSLMFHVNRPGTSTDPDKPARDDAYLASFIRAVFKVPRGQAMKVTPLLKKLIDIARVPDDSVTLSFKREANPKDIQIKDPQTKEVLREKVVVYCKDRFEATPRPAAATA